MSGPKTFTFLEDVMAEAAALTEANKITLSVGAKDAIKGMEGSSKRPRPHKAITYI